MRLPVNVVTAVATAAAFIATASLPASADCKRYGFSVNDYGKDGPTKDAKDLLDKTIASKMAEKGVKDYHTGKKSVSCELFLNFILFDEHTCTAEATVCWGGSQLPASEQAAATDGAAEPTKTSADESATPKTTKKKKKETAGASEHAAPASAPAQHTATAVAVPDPKKPAPEPVSEEKPAFVPPASTDTATDSAAPPADATTATVAEPAAPAKPVETGSLNEKKVAKHKAESSDGGDGAVVAPIKSKSSEIGYPTPLPPSDQPSP